MLQGTLDDRLPEAGAGFFWDDAGTERSVPVLRPEVEGIVAAFTTRIGGVSQPPYDELNVSFRVGDSDECARANREAAGRSIGRDGKWSVVRQVHGIEVVPAQPPGRLAWADGHWTDDPEPTLAVLGADCIPLLGVGAGRLGVVHAGWRGLVAGVVAEATRALGTACSLFAGPSIGPCCYEVGTEVAEAFSERFGPHVISDGGRLDLWTAAETAARRAGAAGFWAARICTSCHPDLFFSHRRDRGCTGRQALIARLGDG